MKQRLIGAVAIAIAACTTLAACGGDENAGGDSGDSPASSGDAPTDDGRELADWAAVQMLTGHSTTICEVGTEDLEIRFGEQGWCEEDATFEQTPVKLTLAASCVVDTDPKVVAGDVYLYHLSPRIELEPSKQSNGLVVTVTETDGEWVVADLKPYSYDVDSVMVSGCGDTLTPQDEDVALD